MRTAATDCYEVLQVRPDAGSAEVRSAFRRLAMRFHPDRNPDRRDWAQERMREITAAYEVLKDEGSRVRHDVERSVRADFQAWSPEAPFSADDDVPNPGTGARILWCLMNQRGDEALEVYGAFALRGDDPFANLDAKDRLDARLCLGEELERHGRHREAFSHLEALCRDPQAPRRYGGFLEEVKDRLRRLGIEKLAPRAEDAEAVELYRRLLAIGLPRRDAAFVTKKLAESLLRLGRHDEARAALTEAMGLDRSLKGVTRIRRKLGLCPAPCA